MFVVCFFGLILLFFVSVSFFSFSFLLFLSFFFFPSFSFLLFLSFFFFLSFFPPFVSMNNLYMKELLAFLVTLILVIVVIILYTRDPEKKDENGSGNGSGSGSSTTDTLNIVEIVPSYLYPTFVYSDKSGKLLKCSLNI